MAPAAKSAVPAPRRALHRTEQQPRRQLLLSAGAQFLRGTQWALGLGTCRARGGRSGPWQLWGTRWVLRGSAYTWHIVGAQFKTDLPLLGQRESLSVVFCGIGSMGPGEVANALHGRSSTKPRTFVPRSRLQQRPLPTSVLSPGVAYCLWIPAPGLASSGVLCLCSFPISSQR